MAEMSKDFQGRTAAGRVYIDPDTEFVRSVRSGPIARPAGGAISDSAARQAIGQILDLLEQAGLSEAN